MRENIGGFQVGDKVRYAGGFISAVNSMGGVSKKIGEIVYIKGGKDSLAVVNWGDGRGGRDVMVANLQKVEEVPIVRENNRMTIMLTDCDGVFSPVSAVDIDLLDEIGLPHSFGYDKLHEMNMSAGSHGLAIVVAEGIQADTSSYERPDLNGAAGDLVAIRDAVATIATLSGVEAHLYDRVQWMESGGSEHLRSPMTINIDDVNDSFLDELDNLAEVASWRFIQTDDMTIHGYPESDYPILPERRLVNVKPTTSMIGHSVPMNAAANVMGVNLDDYSEGSIHTVSGGGYVLSVKEDYSGSTRHIAITTDEAGVIEAAKPGGWAYYLDTISYGSFPEEGGYLDESFDMLEEASVDSEKISKNVKLKAICYKSPKTIKGLKKNIMTGVLYLSPANASGKNVCPFATGLFAQQIADRIEKMRKSDGDDVSKDDLLKIAGEVSKKTGARSGEGKEIAEMIRKHVESGDPTSQLIVALGTIGCAGACLGTTSGRAFMNNTQQVRIDKTIRATSDETREKFMLDIDADVAKISRVASKAKMKPAVRLNGTSDESWGDKKYHVKDSNGKSLSIYDKYPKVQFYDYTKNHAMMKKYLAFKNGDSDDFPKNYHLTFSFNGHNWDQCKGILNAGGNVAVAFRVKGKEDKPVSFDGYKVVNGDETDVRFLDDKSSARRNSGGRGVVVALSAKGTSYQQKTPFIISPFDTRVEWEKGSPYIGVSDEQKKDYDDKHTDSSNKEQKKRSVRKFRRMYQESVVKFISNDSKIWKDVDAILDKMIIDRRSVSRKDRETNKSISDKLMPYIRKAIDKYTPMMASELRNSIDNNPLSINELRGIGSILIGIKNAEVKSGGGPKRKPRKAMAESLDDESMEIASNIAELLSQETEDDDGNISGEKLNIFLENGNVSEFEWAVSLESWILSPCFPAMREVSRYAASYFGMNDLLESIDDGSIVRYVDTYDVGSMPEFDKDEVEIISTRIPVKNANNHILIKAYENAVQEFGNKSIFEIKSDDKFRRFGVVVDSGRKVDDSVNKYVDDYRHSRKNVVVEALSEEDLFNRLPYADQKAVRIVQYAQNMADTIGFNPGRNIRSPYAPSGLDSLFLLFGLTDWQSDKIKPLINSAVEKRDECDAIDMDDLYAKIVEILVGQETTAYNTFA